MDRSDPVTVLAQGALVLFIIGWLIVQIVKASERRAKRKKK